MYTMFELNIFVSLKNIKYFVKNTKWRISRKQSISGPMFIRTFFTIYASGMSSKSAWNGNHPVYNL